MWSYLKGVNRIETEDVHPQVLESSSAGSTDGNLLNTEHSVGLGSSKATLLGGNMDKMKHIQQNWRAFRRIICSKSGCWGNREIGNNEHGIGFIMDHWTLDSYPIQM